jgi:hypothetical protein
LWLLTHFYNGMRVAFSKHILIAVAIVSHSDAGVRVAAVADCQQWAVDGGHE